MCFTSLIVPVTIFGSMAKARRMDSGNAVLIAAAPKALRIVRRSVFAICVSQVIVERMERNQSGFVMQITWFPLRFFYIC